MNKSSNGSHSRTAPHSIEAEESVLGAILLDNEAMDLAQEKLVPEDFYRPNHRCIFQAMISLAERQEPIDPITLSTELRSLGLLEQAGDTPYLTRLATLVPSAANVGYYSDAVRNASIRRKMIHISSSIIDKAFQQDNDIEELLSSSEQEVLSIKDERTNKGFTSVSDIVPESMKVLESLMDRKESITGTPSGFKDLDGLTAGFQKSDLIIVAARPAMGKTALSLTMAQWAGIRKHMGVAIFSLEMSKEQLVLRMLCSEARVDSSLVRTGHLGERDFPKMVDAASRVTEAPIFIDDTPGLSVAEVRAKARRLHREHPLSLIVVDYLQLMKSPAYSRSREQEISDISRNLKGLAKELSVPVIALSQLNRSLESRPNKRPLMSDLRESGAIEQDADVIMFIYRDEVYNEESPDKGVAEIIIAKQRSGPTGTVRLAFEGRYTRFDNFIEQYGEEEQQFETLDVDESFFAEPDISDSFG